MYMEWQTIGCSKKLHEWNPVCTRLAGRPNTGWESDVKEYLRIMKINIWTKRIQDSDKENEVGEKAKTFKHRSCSAWKRRVVALLWVDPTTKESRQLS